MERIMRKFWITAILFLLAIPIIPFALFGDLIDVRALEHPSLYYVFFIGILLLGSDILAPLPSSLIAVFMGVKLGFVYATLAIFLGLMLGSVLGFLLGWYPANYFFKKMLPSDQQASIKTLEHRISYWALVLCRSVPILAESSVIAAGAARLQPVKTMLVLGLTNLCLAMVYAFFGVWGGLDSNPAILFCGGILIPAMGIVLLFLFTKPSFLNQMIINSKHDKNNHS